MDDRHRMRLAFGWVCMFGLVLGTTSWASTAPEGDLTGLDLEDLMEIQVSVAGKKQQRLGDVAAAAYIINQDDLRRAGVTTIPEALRLVPGMEVSQLNSSVWAISSRGFGARFAGKMLVLIDGRSVYTPLFSGVYWDVQDTFIEDIRHIEVIRGPGATLWGANAVNGVINIITKPASETQFGLISLMGGDEESRAGVRYGGKLGDKGHYRAYVQHRDFDAFADPTGGDAADEWEMSRAGFRMDWELGSNDRLTVQGGAYDGETVVESRFAQLPPPYVQAVEDLNTINGFHLQTRWERKTGNESSMMLTAYIDVTERETFQNAEMRDTWDLEYQYQRALGQRHSIVTGLGLRRTEDDLTSTPVTSFNPPSRTDDLVNLFFQDEIRLTDRARLTLGGKFEHNDYTHFEFQPNVRFSWNLGQAGSVWSAISRAVRSPSRSLSDVEFLAAVAPGMMPGVDNRVIVRGNPDLESEQLLAVEFGYRGCRSDRHCFEVAAFHNRYDDLLTIEPGVPGLVLGPIPYVEIPSRLDNRQDGESIGVEVNYTGQLSRRFRISGWYAYLDLETELDADSFNTSPGPELSSAEHRANVSLHLKLSERFDGGLTAYYVDRLPGFDVAEYTRLDSRLSWTLNNHTELHLVLRNLLDGRHTEFDGDLFVVPTAVERSAYAKVVWKF